MCVYRNTENDKFEFDNVLSENSKEEVILGVKIVNKLSKLLRITNNLNSSQKKACF